MISLYRWSSSIFFLYIYLRVAVCHVMEFELLNCTGCAFTTTPLGWECSSETLKRIHKRCQEPVLSAWLEMFFIPKR